MRYNYIKSLLTTLLLLCSTVASAHDFEVDGVFYNIISEEDKTVEVTYKDEYSVYLGSITIPETVTYNDNIYRVTSIGYQAFYGCSSLTSIEIPSEITSIGGYAFYRCSALTSIEIPSGVTNIGENAFCGCSGLTSIEIPNSITTIGNGVFYCCYGLTSITIPNSVTTIGGSAFSGCIRLTSITIPNSVTTIEDLAFESCNGLTSITIPNSVTTIEDYAFANCSGLTSIILYIDLFVPGNNVFYGIDKNNCILYVPAGAKAKYAATDVWKDFKNIVEFELEYDGKCGDNVYWSLDKETGTLTIFGEGEMYDYESDSTPWYSDRENISIITISNGVTTIGNRAFSSCYGLTSVKIPSSVTIIGDKAFCDCHTITSITIPNSVTTIGDEAFRYCHSLTDLTIPSSVTKIGENAFYFCHGLISIEVDRDNPKYDSRNCNAIIETATNTLIKGCRNTIIPSVTAIGNDAFSGCYSITSITIPNSITTIGNGAFYSCFGLTSIEMPSVTNIGDYAFYKCSGLTSIRMPSVANIGDGAFYNCSGLTIIEIPNSVKTIGDEAFAYCFSITNIISHIPADNLFVPGNNAFNGIDKNNCTLYVPVGDVATYTATEGWNEFTNTVELFDGGKCGYNVYWSLDKETGTLTIFGEGEMYDYNSKAPWYSDREYINTVTIGSGVTSIGDHAFINCNSLTSVNIPNSINRIGVYAFRGCTALTSIKIPSEITSIGRYAFYRCSALTSIEIPSGVTNIGDYAFCGCSGLTSIVVDENNAVYDSRDNCNAIIKTESNTLIVGCKNTIIPNNVTSIGDYAFEYCTALTNIEIPNSIKNIGNYTFNGCTTLTSITIGNSVTSIGMLAFNSCSSLTRITSHIPADKLFVPGNNAFYGIDKNNCTLYVPYGAKATYAATEGWKKFTNIVELNPTEVTITISQYGSGTYCSPYALDFSNVKGLKAYCAIGYKTSTQVVTLARVMSADAGQGVVVKGEPGSYTVPIIENFDEYTLNMLVGTLERCVVNSISGDYSNYKLTVVDGNSTPMFYPFADNTTFSANRAYLQIPTAWLPATAQKSLSIRFDDGETTDIEELEGNDNSEKIYYDLSGRRIDNPTKGLYIVNGKKVYVK